MIELVEQFLLHPHRTSLWLVSVTEHALSHQPHSAISHLLGSGAMTRDTIQGVLVASSALSLPDMLPNPLIARLSLVEPLLELLPEVSLTEGRLNRCWIYRLGRFFPCSCSSILAKQGLNSIPAQHGMSRGWRMASASGDLAGTAGSSWVGALIATSSWETGRMSSSKPACNLGPLFGPPPT